MSRSYRAPWFTDGYKNAGKRKFWKKNYSKVIRRIEDVPNGNAYRKFNDPYNICDFKFLYDPHPRYYWRNGELVSYEPTPVWKVIRK